MGSKAAIVAFAEGDPRAVLHSGLAVDAAASARLAEEFFGGPLEPSADVMLDEAVWPANGTVCAGSFTGLEIVCAQELAQVRPRDLTEKISQLSAGRKAFAVFMHSAVDSLAFATWSDGQLMRSLSMAPDDGVLEDLGERMEFEEPFWGGGNPVAHAPGYPFDFHPLDLGNEALRNFFGFILEGDFDDSCIDPEEVILRSFRRPVENRVQSESLKVRAEQMIKRW